MGDGFTARGQDTDTCFNIDLTDGDYTDYDESGDCPVSVLDFKARVVQK